MEETKKASPRKPKYTKLTVATGGRKLNVRSDASASAEILGDPLRDGAEVMAAAEKDGWRELKGGGFVMAEFLA